MKVKTHFEILQHIFLKSRFKNPKANNAKLTKLIEYHKSLLKITNDLNETFDFIFLFQTVFSGVQMCLIVFQLSIHSTSENIFDILPNYFYITTLWIDFLIYCYGGTLITTESLKLSFAIQGSAWYNLSISDQKSLMFMIAKSQISLKISFGFFEASLDTFVVVCEFFRYFFF